MEGILVLHTVIPSIKFTSAHLQTWVKRGTMIQVKCRVQEPNSSPGKYLNLSQLNILTVRLKFYSHA